MRSQRSVMPSKSQPALGDFFTTIQDLVVETELFTNREASVRDAVDSDFYLADAEVALPYTRQVLRHLHNFKQPVMRLPPEILAMIFCCLRDMWQCTSHGLDLLMVQSHQFGDMRWLSVTRVCQRWRNAALAHPRLWTGLHIRAGSASGEVTRRQMQTCLNRAGKLPLDVEVETLGDGLLPLLVEYMPCIRMLRLGGFGRLSLEDQSVVFDSDAPLLTALSINTTPKADTAGQLLLPTLFHGNHPRLTALGFWLYTRYGNNAFGGLKHLHMSKQKLRTQDDIRALSQFLSGMPLLEDLMFSHTDIDDMLVFTPYWHHPTPGCALPHLRRAIFVRMSLALAGFLLSCLDIPLSQALAILHNGDYYGSEEMDPNYSVRALRFFPQWEEIASAAQSAAIKHSDDGWDIILAGEKREAFFRRLLGSYEDSATLVPLIALVTHVQEIWLWMEDYWDKDGNYAAEASVPVCVLQSGRNLKRAFIRGEGDLFHLLAPLCRDYYNSLARLEDLHILVNEEDSLPIARAFFEELRVSDIGQVQFHLYCPSLPHAAIRWKETLLSEGLEVMHRVILHTQDDLPTMPMAASSAPCAYSWRSSV